MNINRWVLFFLCFFFLPWEYLPPFSFQLTDLFFHTQISRFKMEIKKSILAKNILSKETKEKNKIFAFLRNCRCESSENWHFLGCKITSKFFWIRRGNAAIGTEFFLLRSPRITFKTTDIIFFEYVGKT